MRLELRELKTKPYQCERCGKAYTSPMRLQHHMAAEHSVKTVRDIHTMHDIHYRPRKVALNQLNALSTRRKYEQHSQS